MKKLVFTFVILLYTFGNVHAQGVYISSGSNLFIGSGATVSLDSLVLKPSASFNITGLRREYRNTAVVHTLAKPYIKRVYHFSTTTAAFSGAVSIYYRDAELNGIAESALTLHIHDGAAWNAYTSGVLRNSTSNFVTTSVSSIPLNELTLASNTAALLTMNKAGVETEEDAAALAVFPNPVVDVTTVRIRSVEQRPAILQLFDAAGALLQEQHVNLAKGGNQVQLNLSTYAKGNYTLVAEGKGFRKMIPLVKQ